VLRETKWRQLKTYREEDTHSKGEMMRKQPDTERKTKRDARDTLDPFSQV
jgi:hypothetical protein